jgi:hypothetical protein
MAQKVSFDNKRNDVDDFYVEKKVTLYDFGFEIPRFASIFRQICGGNSESD